MSRAKDNPNVFRERVKIEGRISQEFDERWGWLVEEYAQQSKKLQEINSSFQQPEEQLAKVDLKPYPRTSTGMIGWLSTKPKFQLERFGPDVLKEKPLPDIYVVTRLSDPLSDGLEYCN